MSGEAAPAPVPRAPKGVKPQVFSDPAIDKLLAMVIQLTAELSVTRDRLDALERLTVKAGVLAPDALETLQLSAAEEDDRHAARQALITRVLRVIDQELDEIARPDRVTSLDDVMTILADRDG
jgi:hypothetical protein